MKNIFLAAALVSVLAGCSHGQRVYAEDQAKLKTEDNAMWSRPQEMGYTVGERLEGTAVAQCVFFFICWGAEEEGSGAAVTGLILAASGKSAVHVDGLAKEAAGRAVMATTNDGILLLNQETDKFDILIYSSHRTKVIGKAIRLKPLGEVSLERADRDRYLKDLSGAELHLGNGVSPWGAGGGGASAPPPPAHAEPPPPPKPAEPK